MTQIPDKLMYRIGEAAKLLSVHPTTVKRWIFEGKLQSIITCGGHNRIHKAEIARLIQERYLHTLNPHP